MEKPLSVIALLFAVSLAACQPKPENAPAPSPVIESPMQQTTPVPVEPSPKVSATPTVSNTTSKPAKTGKTGSAAKTVTTRLDALEKRVKRMEDAARQYGFNFSGRQRLRQ